ncbi:MAG: thioredoxin [Terriglobus roseus]|nr:thioredoxin [Terriglobus roseus]
MSITNVSSSSQFASTLSSNTFVIADFYADWCGPCKAIAPVFEELAKTHAQKGRVAFVKVDVDAQRDVASKYSVSAMPTFLVFKKGSVANTIRGANPAALRNAVQAAATEAKNGPVSMGASFSGKGRTLGSGGDGPAPGAGQRVATALGSGFPDMVVRFVALYFTTLFSLDSYAAARDSPFSVRQGR